LPKTDSKIDNILGLSVFYQHVRTAALSIQQQTQHVSVFTTEYFAQYLRIRCLSVTQCPQLMKETEIERFQKCCRKSYGMFIADVLALKSVRGTKCARHFRKLMFGEDETKPVTSGHLDISELVKLLQQSAVEHLTTLRKHQAQKFGSVFTIVTTDYEALYAYKCGEYQRCLQLSTDNVRTLISDPYPLSRVFMFPEFIQLMDDDIVSLSGLTLILNPEISYRTQLSVRQLILSLYLMTQCQIKLHHLMAQTLDYIEATRHICERRMDALDQLLLKLTERKIQMYITSVNSDQPVECTD